MSRCNMIGSYLLVGGVGDFDFLAAEAGLSAQVAITVTICGS